MSAPFLAYNYTGDPVVAAAPGGGLFAVPLPANTLNTGGAMLKIMAFGWMTEDTSDKIIRVKVGNILISSFVLDDENDGWLQELWLTRKGDDGTLIRAKLSFTTCYDMGMPTAGNGLLHFGSRVPNTPPGINWATDNVLMISADGPLSPTVTVTGIGCTVEAWPR